jgi:hypothetical protein
MTTELDATIAALRVLLAEAERRHDFRWKIAKVNDWIARLPGAWRGRWRRLKLRADYPHLREADLENVITHLRATLAYLESYRSREQARALRFWRVAREKPAPQTKDAKIIQMPENKRLH